MHQRIEGREVLQQAEHRLGLDVHAHGAIPLRGGVHVARDHHVVILQSWAVEVERNSRVTREGEEPLLTEATCRHRSHERLELLAVHPVPCKREQRSGQGSDTALEITGL